MNRIAVMRVLAAHLAVLLACLLGGVYVWNNTAADIYSDCLHQRLVEEARLLSAHPSVSWNAPTPELTELARKYRDSTGNRVIFVSRDDAVLADSDWPDHPMQYYAQRPEIREALKGKQGFAIRYSPALHTRVLCAAVPVKAGGRITGAVSLSAPLAVPPSFSERARPGFLVVIALGILASFLISMFFITRLWRQAAEITGAAEALANGNLKARVHYRREDDLGSLAAAFNRTAANIEKELSGLEGIKNRLETVLTHTVNGIILIGSDRRILYINPVACRLLGVGVDEALKKPEAVFSRSYALFSGVDRVFHECRPLITEIVLHHYGGTVLDTSIVPVMNGPDPDGALVVMNDITRLKRLEIIRRDFVANVSHELKTPLASISGYAETLMLENQENEEVCAFAGIIYEEASRLTRLVNGLLELTRLESETPDLRRQTFDMKECVMDTLKKMEPKLGERRIKVHIDGPEDGVRVEADRDRITQVLINLIDNAINHSAEGGAVRIEIKRRPMDVYVAVIDRGPGIAPDDQERVFERLYRVDRSRARKYGGYGLGLSIVRHIVEAHGGTMGVISNPGEGAAFYFTLPYR